MAESEQTLPPEDETTPAKGAPGDPTVVVSHLDVHYTVYGSGRRGAPSGQGTSVSFSDRLRRNRPAPKVREIHAVKDVSFVARHGESIGIIGRNGSGKSTLLRAVAGLIPPSAGRLWVSGEPSLLGVNAVLMSKLSGERNIYIGAQALGLSKAEIAERFDDIVEFSGIGDAVYLPMNTYSSGMGARLRFAISTAAAPDVLMIDEALATGDAHFRHKSAERIKQIREQAGTVFLVSHSNSNIREICDRVLWMDQGRLIMDGATEEVLTAYEATLPSRGGKKKKAAPPPNDPHVQGTVRWTGANRYDVATEITRNTWSPGVEGCFVLSSNRYAAARVVAPIAAQLGWPLLWVRPGVVSGATLRELGRLQPRRVIVVGGEELVSAEAYARIEEISSGTVERMGADDATQTSIAMLRAFPPGDTSTVHITPMDSRGRAPAVSLVAAVHDQAVVAIDYKHADPELVDLVAGLSPERLLFSGNEEDWSSEVLDQFRAVTPAPIDFLPKGGPMALAASLWEDAEPGGEIMTTGGPVAEMLTATVAAVHTGTPLFVFTGDGIPSHVAQILTQLKPTSVVLAATLDAAPPALRQELGRFVGPGRVGQDDTGEGAEQPADAASPSNDAASRSDSATR